MTYTVGIDVGTTYTAAAVARDGRDEVVSLGVHTPIIPSVVFLAGDGGLVVGEAAERRGRTDPSRVARQFKRRLGDPAPIVVAGLAYSPVALTARLLRFVVDAVTDQQHEAPAITCLTYPANWSPYKREVFGEAVKVAGLVGVMTTTEPEAAAVHYASGTRVDEGTVIAVYDLGGGTFDAALLRKVGGGFEGLGPPEGIEHLGGIDFDETVFGYVIRSLGDRYGTLDQNDPGFAAGMAALRQECVAAKEALSADTAAAIPVSLPGLRDQVRLTRRELEDLIRPALNESVAALGRGIRAARVDPAEINAVVLVGGSSRIPIIAQLVQSGLGLQVAVDTHPKHSVALGAAHLADAALQARRAAAEVRAGRAPAALAAAPSVTGANSEVEAPTEEVPVTGSVTEPSPTSGADTAPSPDRWRDAGWPWRQFRPARPPS
jgi:molecular chaperone DnaK